MLLYIRMSEPGCGQIDDVLSLNVSANLDRNLREGLVAILRAVPDRPRLINKSVGRA